jgi:hypothetical protein
MKNKIISALKTKYPNRGFSDKAFDGVAEFLSKTVTEETQIEDAVTGIDGLLKVFQGEADSIRTAKRTEAEKKVEELEKQVKELGGAPAPKPNPTGGDDLEAKIAAIVATKVAEETKPLREENAAFKAERMASARATLIATKAKELGLPEFMIKHGFVIPEDADETAIGATLAAIKQDYVTAGLESGDRFPLDSKDKVSKEEADRIVANMNG